MSVFQWDECYRTGIETVDDQHQRLIDMINCLDEGIRTGSEDTVLAKLLDELISYTQYHFSNEERMMADPAFDQDQFAGHKATHDAFVKRILDAQKTYSEGTGELSGELMEYLVSWLIDHMVGTDKQMAATLQQCRHPAAVNKNGNDTESLTASASDAAGSNLIAALRESQERFKDLADSVPALIWMSAPDQQRQYCNHHWQEFTGLDLDGLRSRWREYLHAEDCTGVVAQLATAHEERNGCKLEYRLRRAAGDYRWIHESVMPRYLKDGEFLGLVGCGFDVTSQKNAKAAVERANANLEQEVAARTQELLSTLDDLNNKNTELESTNEELRITQNNLVQAEKMKSIGQLAAGIAHEINTPSQYVGDNTRFLQDAFGDIGRMIDQLGDLAAKGDDSIPGEAIQQALDDADAEYLKKEVPRAIKQSLEGVDHVTKIVCALKDFSRPIHDKTEISLNQAIESTITVATNEWTSVAEVETSFDSGLPKVSCLPTDINQVILNMLVNAVHAISKVVGDGARGKGTITVSTHSLDGWAEIRIADTGCGMPEDVRKKIFDPFFTTKDVGEGIGQGLSVAHSVIVEKHGGTIAVNSEPGKGSCFTIRLPVNESTSKDASVAA